MAEPVTPPTTASLWGAPAISIYTLTIMIGAMAIAWLTKNDNAMTLLTGAAIANATTIINFWVGSSAGSQKKDETIAAQSAAASKGTP